MCLGESSVCAYYCFEGRTIHKVKPTLDKGSFSFTVTSQFKMAGKAAVLAFSLPKLNFLYANILVSKRSQLSWRIYLRCNFCRLIKAVTYAIAAEKRWRPISASFVSTSRAQTRIRITVINVESAGEFPKIKVVFRFVQQFSRLAIFFSFVL